MALNRVERRFVSRAPRSNIFVIFTMVRYVVEHSFRILVDLGSRYGGLSARNRSIFLIISITGCLERGDSAICLHSITTTPCNSAPLHVTSCITRSLLLDVVNPSCEILNRRCTPHDYFPMGRESTP